jgi:RNA polymerase sigma-70 factor (ECF subfamily)
MTLLEQALRRLGAECAAAGREALFAAARPILSGDDVSSPYAALAERLGMKEGALKTAVHRHRRRFAAVLRAEITQTVFDPRDVGEEICHLFSSLR